MSDVVTRADIERLCWHLSGWQVEQRSVDELLAAVDVYAGYGTDLQPQTPSQTQGAPALALGGGVGEAVRPAEAPAVPDPVPEPSEAPSGPQTGVQRIHLTGTLTLVCPGEHVPAQPAPQTPKERAARYRRSHKKVPPELRQRADPSPDPHDPTQPERSRPCRVCKRTQPIEEYVRDVHGRRGRKTICRTCENTRKRERRAQQAAQAA